jgi:hypothetical protein
VTVKEAAAVRMWEDPRLGVGEMKSPEKQEKEHFRGTTAMSKTSLVMWQLRPDHGQFE